MRYLTSLFTIKKSLADWVSLMTGMDRRVVFFAEDQPSFQGLNESCTIYHLKEEVPNWSYRVRGDGVVRDYQQKNVLFRFSFKTSRSLLDESEITPLAYEYASNLTTASKTVCSHDFLQSKGLSVINRQGVMNMTGATGKDSLQQAICDFTIQYMGCVEMSWPVLSLTQEDIDQVRVFEEEVEIEDFFEGYYCGTTPCGSTPYYEEGTTPFYGVGATPYDFEEEATPYFHGTTPLYEDIHGEYEGEEMYKTTPDDEWEEVDFN